VLTDLVDLICMVYHEARNVRHPLAAGHLKDGHRFALLIDLATKREEAWRQMKPIRRKAAQSKAPGGIVEAFEDAYHLSLADLAELFGRSFWRHSRHGGNAWAAIALQVERAAGLHTAGKLEERDNVVRAVLAMRHNTGLVTGLVHEKLSALRHA
jgi:hypothetical protein